MEFQCNIYQKGAQQMKDIENRFTYRKPPKEANWNEDD